MARRSRENNMNVKILKFEQNSAERQQNSPHLSESEDVLTSKSLTSSSQCKTVANCIFNASPDVSAATRKSRWSALSRARGIREADRSGESNCCTTIFSFLPTGLGVCGSRCQKRAVRADEIRNVLMQAEPRVQAVE